MGNMYSETPLQRSDRRSRNLPLRCVHVETALLWPSHITSGRRTYIWTSENSTMSGHRRKTRKDRLVIGVISGLQQPSSRPLHVAMIIGRYPSDDPPIFGR